MSRETAGRTASVAFSAGGRAVAPSRPESQPASAFVRVNRDEPSEPAAPAIGSAVAPRLIRVSGVQPPAMSPFRQAAQAEARAIECLTTAVYYEARGEGADGMAAVAQVILNRVRHPLFPKSVCGVVYQGCQFSFVCGGMRGGRNAALWSRSREIAEAALSGEVMGRVGTATHFHATRLNPRWPGLSRVATIGRHVFYAYAGRRGHPSTFLDVIGGARTEVAAAPRREAEAPAYAMLPRQAADELVPTTPVESTPAAETAPPAAAAAAGGESAPASGLAPLPNAPVTQPSPLSAPIPVA